MELIVAEKPKVAHTIAKALGGSSVKQKGKGAISYYECEVGGKKVVVAPAVGHLFNLAEKKRSRDYPVFDIEWKPAYSVSKSSAFTKAYVELLNTLGKRAGMCTVACDYDIEGCLPASEEVLIERGGNAGFEKIGELVDGILEKKGARERNGFEYARPGDELRVPVMEPGSLRCGYGKIRNVMRRRGTGKILRITLEHGRVIHVTHNHPAFIFGKSGLKVRKAGELAAGHYLPAVREIPKTKGEKTELDLIDEAVRLGQAGRFYIYGFSGMNQKMPAEVARLIGVKRKTALGWRFWDRIPLEAYLKLEEDKSLRKGLRIGVKKGRERLPCILPLDRDFGKLIGYYLAEGCTDSSGFVGFYFGPSEMDLVNEVEGIFREKLLVKNLKKRTRKVAGQFGNSVTPEIGTKAGSINFLFGEVLGLGKNAHAKTLPGFAVSAPGGFRSGIVDGYLLGDGSAFVSKKDSRCIVSAGSKSEGLIKRLHAVLLSLGIESSIVRGKKKKMFYLHIGTPHEIKKLLEMDACSVVRRRDLEGMVARSASSGRKRRGPAACIPNFIAEECEMEKQTARNIRLGGPGARTSIDSLASAPGLAGKIINNPVFPCKITKIEEIEYDGPVYDLETETGSFMHGDGIVTHNSVIGYNVYRFCYGKKPGKRMKFSSLVPDELREAYENASEGLDLNNAHAGEARHILDWYYGINLSRALMNALRKAGGFKTMSIGRVQGPALSLLSEKEKAISEFVPEDYWEVKIWLRDTEFLHEKERFMEEGEAKKAHSAIGKEAVVESIEKKERKIWPYPPFDLTSLQLEAHRCFGMSPSQTLSVAQSLYENSLISYPRTSSQKLPMKLGLKRIIRKLAENPQYKGRAEKLVEKGWDSKPMEGKKSDPAHPAIHPTGLSKPLEGSEKKLYDLIVCRFLSVFAPPAKAQGTKIVAETGGERFRASGEMIGERNWIEFYPYYKGKERELPAFSEGGRESVGKKSKVKKQTKAPPRYTPASIISELEKRRLGTKATRSTIIDTLFKRNYVSGKSISVTDFGMKVWKVLGKYSPKILDAELTRKIEEDMDKIVEGETTEEKVVGEGKGVLVGILEDFKKHEAGIGKELLAAMRETEEKENDMGPCPKCRKNNLRIIRLRNGNQFIGCGGYPECRNIYPLPHGAYVAKLKKPCPVCGMAMVRVRRGRMRFEMCIDPKCKSKESWGKKKAGKGGDKDGGGERGKKEAGSKREGSAGGKGGSGKGGEGQKGE